MHWNAYFYIQLPEVVNEDIMVLMVPNVNHHLDEIAFKLVILSTQHEINVLRGQVTETLNTFNYKQLHE